MIDTLRAGRVPVLTAATAALLTAGLLAATTTPTAATHTAVDSVLPLLAWAVALVGAVVQFLTVDRPSSRTGIVASVVSLLATSALWGALDHGPARVLACAATVLLGVLATGSVLARASRPAVEAG